MEERLVGFEPTTSRSQTCTPKRQSIHVLADFKNPNEGAPRHRCFRHSLAKGLM
jgi:hypothetical protein